MVLTNVTTFGVAVEVYVMAVDVEDEDVFNDKYICIVLYPYSGTTLRHTST
jgi:hypothetical protein